MHGFTWSRCESSSQRGHDVKLPQESDVDAHALTRPVKNQRTANFRACRPRSGFAAAHGLFRLTTTATKISFLVRHATTPVQPRRCRRSSGGVWESSQRPSGSTSWRRSFVTTGDVSRARPALSTRSDPHCSSRSSFGLSCRSCFSSDLLSSACFSWGEPARSGSSASRGCPDLLSSSNLPEERDGRAF